MLNKLFREAENAVAQKYSTGDIIFSAGEQPVDYHHILEGEVKLYNKEGDAKELVQEIEEAGHGIAEFCLFVDETYPVTAVAVTNCLIIRLPKANFFTLLEEHPEIGIQLLQNMSNSLYYKFLMANIQFRQNTADRIVMLMSYLKKQQPNQKLYSFQIPLTRREIANLTGLRVETVIRTIKKLEKQKVLKIVDHKIFY